MIDIGEAQRQVLEEIPILGTGRIHILEALGRVLTQDVTSDRNVPMCQNSAMDGYACCHEDVAGTTSENPVRLRLIGESPAGNPHDGFFSFLVKRIDENQERETSLRPAYGCNSGMLRGSTPSYDTTHGPR